MISLIVLTKLLLFNRNKGHGSGCKTAHSGMHRYLTRVYCRTLPISLCSDSDTQNPDILAGPGITSKQSYTYSLGLRNRLAGRRIFLLFMHIIVAFLSRQFVFFCAEANYGSNELNNATPSDHCWKTKSSFIYVLGPTG